MNNKLFRDDRNGRGGVDAAAARNKAIADLLSAAGASVSVVKMAIRQSDGSLMQSVTETINADEYAHETDPEGWTNISILREVTIAYRQVDNIGKLPVAVIMTDDKQAAREYRPAAIFSMIYTFDIDPDHYAKSEVRSAYDRLRRAEAIRMKQMEDALTEKGAIIRRYTVTNGDEKIRTAIDTKPLTVRDYIERVSPFEMAEDSSDRTCTYTIWMNTLAGWLPAFVGRDKDVEEGYLICLPDEDDNEDDEFE